MPEEWEKIIEKLNALEQKITKIEEFISEAEVEDAQREAITEIERRLGTVIPSSLTEKFDLLSIRDFLRELDYDRSKEEAPGPSRIKMYIMSHPILAAVLAVLAGGIGAMALIRLLGGG